MRGGRLRRTVVALTLMLALGVALSLLNLFLTRRDLALAAGPESPAQREWLIASADRPDVAQFFKNLPHDRRVAMAKAIARYDDAPLAKLSGTLLADFDAEAREALVQGLVRVVRVHPEAVAEQLKQKGSFQQLGVSRALRTLGDAAIPSVVGTLSIADARPTAVAFLIASGAPAIAPLLPLLNDPTLEVRLATADALGGLRAHEAVSALRTCLRNALPADRPAYLNALAAIGDPATADLFASTLEGEGNPIAERSAAALGLGRIGGEDAARILWRYALSDEPVLASAALAALTLAGSGALEAPDAPPRLRVRVAAALKGPEADGVIDDGLRRSDTRLDAIVAARDRPELVPALRRALARTGSDGDLASALVAALRSTPGGRWVLASYPAGPELSGFVRRAEQG